jgi:predicted esterase
VRLIGDLICAVTNGVGTLHNRSDNHGVSDMSAIAAKDGVEILIASGMRDPIIPLENAARLASLLEQHGAVVEHRILPSGHELSQADVSLAQTWWQAHAFA